MRVLLSCVAEDRPDFHRRVETLLISRQALGGRLADMPCVVHVVGSAQPAFTERVAELGGEVRVVPGVLKGKGGHANKLRMLDLAGHEDFDILLAVDCDVAVASDPTTALPAGAIGAAPGDASPLQPRRWEALFAAQGLVMPPSSLRATSTGRAMPPYFNSGVLSVPRALCRPLRDGWIAAIDQLDALFSRDPMVIPPPQRFFVDQLALMMVLLGELPVQPLPAALNFPTHVRVRAPEAHAGEPCLLHYHGDLDARGFLVQPVSPMARRAADRVNRARAGALAIPYHRLRPRSRTQDATARLRRRVLAGAGSTRAYHTRPVTRLRRALRDHW